MRVAITAAVFVSAAGVSLGAHEGPHAAPGPSSWDLAVLIGLAAGAALYAIGSVRLARRGARVRRIERIAFWIGWTSMCAAVAPPMDRAASQLFSMHMAQHELLMLIGGPLMIVGRPIVPWLWALPAAIRPRAAAALQSSPAAGLWRWLTTPLVAWGLHGAAIWIWHVPALYEAAVRNEGVHAFQHATFVGTAVFFWWGLVYGRYGRAAYGASALYVFVTSVHTGILGALLTLSSAPFYPLYVERAAEAGIDPVIDQQLAGLYMWIPAGLILTLFGLGLVLAWLSEAERRAVARKAVLFVIIAVMASACRSIPHDKSARAITGGDPYRGRTLIAQYGCDTCHTIPGIATADALVGPPLDRVARRMLLAGHIQNTPENMMQWIRTPHAFDRQTAMPDMGVTEQDSRDITAYLYTLR